MQFPILLGVDSGGTFTDFVLLRDGSVSTHKVLSTPDAPEQAILKGFRELGLERQSVLLIHGTTVATNAVLQGNGVRTAYVTNQGFADVLSIGRQARPDLYALEIEPKPVPVPRHLCFEVNARCDADGIVLQALDSSQLSQLRAAIQDCAAKAVAVNLLFSFIAPEHEQAIAAALPDDLFISLSSQILPQAKEYERGIATWLNASVGPLVQGYIRRLQQALAQSAESAAVSVSIMQSSAGTIAADQAADKAVHLLLSGPAGGMVGARFVGAELAGAQQLLSFDMGGTSTDVALIDGDIRLTTEGDIAGYPVAVPMVDMHTIGAGGGSLAYLDSGGLLCVGPASAGALPGPACYGKGGTRATVSDANLVLGRLQADAFLGGSMRLDVDAASRAMQALAEPMGVSVEEAAQGVIRVVDEHMARALRVMSVQRGVDPAQLTLICFGGAGGLHVCSLADNLKMRRALVPIHAGVLSALGMLRAPKSRQLSHSVNQQLNECEVDQLEYWYAALEARAADELLEEGVTRDQLRFRRQVDLRYRGQSYELCIDWQAPTQVVDAFHQAHQDRYGHRLDYPIQLVNLRVAASSPPLPIRLPPLAPATSAATPRQQVTLFGFEHAIPLFVRDDLRHGDKLRGPALICETASTTFLADHWFCEVDSWGNLLLHGDEMREA